MSKEYTVSQDPEKQIQSCVPRFLYAHFQTQYPLSGQRNKKPNKNMKKFFCFLALIGITSTTVAQPVKINNGQSISIRTTKSVSSKSKNPDVTAIVDRDVKDITGEKVLIRRGTPVELALDAQKAKGVGKPGSIDISLLSTTAVDGQRIALLGGINCEGDDCEGAALGCGLGLGLTVLFPFGFFFLCMKGENVKIPANTIIPNVVINDNYLIRVEE